MFSITPVLAICLRLWLQTSQGPPVTHQSGPGAAIKSVASLHPTLKFDFISRRCSTAEKVLYLSHFNLSLIRSIAVSLWIF
ncbi:hypothetical protein HZ326_12510 [Fusarium oxysporum f. sp. albedinis]|nr:hypothetical protein HZ326_12510 [Fusarium oxysporum f. sp. albedinis]